MVEWQGMETEAGKMMDKVSKITVKFHKKRINEDLNLTVLEGDFILYNQIFYEITILKEPRLLFGQQGESFEIIAECKIAREGSFVPPKLNI